MAIGYKSYKIRCYPNNTQITLFRKNCGAARWAYNFALERKQVALRSKAPIPNAIKLSKELNQIKGTPILPWAYEVSCRSFQEALFDCDKAFKNFFDKCKKKVKGKKGFPKFKSKKNDKQSFTLKENINVQNNICRLPKIGTVRLAQVNYLPENIKIMSATISSRAGKWFVSFLVKQEIEQLTKNDKVVGVDLGIKTLATCSDGKTYANPRALVKNLKKLKRKQRQLARKQKGSRNREKARLRLAKLHCHIANIRKDCLHKATTSIVSENQTIVLESLNVNNMMKNHRLAQAISDVGFYEFRRQIEYKARWYGRQVNFADTFYPSSKLCSKCGWKHDNLTLSDRLFKCRSCNQEIDRDLNAAINLKKTNTVSYTEINACGVATERTEKQEFNTETEKSLISLE